MGVFSNFGVLCQQITSGGHNDPVFAPLVVGIKPSKILALYESHA